MIQFEDIPKLEYTSSVLKEVLRLYPPAATLSRYTTEDDCQMAPDAVQRFTNLLPYLWHHQHQWDIFMGGLTSVSDVKLVSRDHALFRAKGLTTHFCLIHKAAYDKLLKHMPSNPEDLKDPIDVLYSNTFRLWTTYPFLATQRPSQSDLEGKRTDYSDLFEIAGEHFQALLNK